MLRKLFIVLFAILTLSAFSGSPRKLISVPNATTQYGINLAIGDFVYDVSGDKLYVILAAAGSTSTLNASSKTLIGPSSGSLVEGTVVNQLLAWGGSNWYHTANTLVYESSGGGHSYGGVYDGSATGYTWDNTASTSTVQIMVGDHIYFQGNHTSTSDSIQLPLLTTNGIAQVKDGNGTLFSTPTAGILQNNTASGKSYYFPGASNYISLGTSTQLDLGTGDGTYFITFKNTGNSGTYNYLFGSYNGGSNDYQDAGIHANGTLYFGLNDAGTLKETTGSSNILADGKVHSVAFIANRASATAGLDIYLDGKEDNITISVNGSTLGNYTPSATKYIGSLDGTNYPFNGNIYRFKYFNCALTATEIQALSEGGPTPYKYQGAVNTELMTNGTFETNTTGWTNESLTTFARNTSSPIDGTGDLHIAQSGNVWSGSSSPTISGLKIGKAYLLKFKARIPTGSLQIRGKEDQGVWNVNYPSWPITTISGSTTTTYTFPFIATYATLSIIFVNDGSTPLPFDAYIDDISVIQQGETVSLDGSGISTSTWYDGSGNQVNGTASGTALSNMSLATYNTIVGATNRDLYIDNAGVIGYVSSDSIYKTNIRDLANCNWLYKLKPKTYVYKTDKGKNLQYGLIAESVDTINKNIVSYDIIPGTTTETTTVKPVTVNYTRLIVPILKAIQDQHDTLKSHKDEISSLTNLLVSTITITPDTNGIKKSMLAKVIYVSLNSALTMPAGKSQIANGADGQEITLVGMSNSNTITLHAGDNIKINTSTITLKKYQTLTLIYAQPINVWVEKSRSLN